MSWNGLLPALFGIGGLVVAWFIYQKVKQYPEGEDKVGEIAEAIHLGAMVFMQREYKMLSIFCAVLVVLLWSPLDSEDRASPSSSARCFRRGRLHRHVARPPAPTCAPPLRPTPRVRPRR